MAGQCRHLWDFSLKGKQNQTLISLSLSLSCSLPLSQMSWEDVRCEMVKEKGLSEEAADQIGEYVSMQGEAGSVIVQILL